MKRGFLIILASLIFSTNISAESLQEPSCNRTWDTKDTIIEITWQAINVIDYFQTMEIARNPQEWEEYNPILGKHPTTDEVTIYFITYALVHAGVSYILPDKYRVWFQGITFGYTISCVTNNMSAGIRINW
jgi:hypothetical protein